MTLSGQILPGTANSADLGLAAELSLGADFAGDAGHFGSEGIELIDHRVDGVFEFEDFAFDVDGDLLRQIARGHRGRHFGDVSHLAGQVAGHGIHVIGKVLPGASDARHLRLAAELSFGSHFARHTGNLAGKGIELVDHGVDRVFQFEDIALHVDGDLLRQIAARNGRGHLGNVAHLASQIAGHQVHTVGKIGPGASDTFNLRLTAQFSFRSHFAGDSGSLRKQRN